MISAEQFGVTQKGERVMLFRLCGTDATAEILSFGCAIRSVRVPDAEGKSTEVCAGYGTLREYETETAWMGAIVGRTSGRIKGARFSLNGREYLMNANDGENQLHGGPTGFSHRVWDWEISGDTLIFSRLSPDGEEGYPGALRVYVSYTLSDKNELIVDYRAVCEEDTFCSLTNHAYWHLGGGADGLSLLIDAQEYVEAGADLLPTGRLLPMAGDAFDFRDWAPLKGVFLDHSFPVSNAGLRRVCGLRNRQNGIKLSVLSTLPSIHVYTPPSRESVALEAQFVPNGMNSRVFPAPLLKKGEVWKHRTVYKFEKEKGD